jgi:XRE family aerobic/anaerobic benzoate catabolism transcriptional regulator
MAVYCLSRRSMPPARRPSAPRPSLPVAIPEISFLARAGARVRAERNVRGWTQAELARRSGMSVRFLADFERGEGNASLVRVAEVAAALGVSVATLVGGLGPAADAASQFAAMSPEQQRIGLRAARGPEKIALVGLRGAGKSTVGKALARALGARFVEVDVAVEQRAGLRLAAIFEFHGAARYRELERAALEALLSEACPAVLATGGSVVTAPESWSLLRREARTAWLRASPASHLARVEAQGDFRPMRGRENARAELEAILSAREPLYAMADVTVDTERKAVADVVGELRAWVGSAGGWRGA